MLSLNVCIKCSNLHYIISTEVNEVKLVLQMVHYFRNSGWKFCRKVQNDSDSNAFCAVGPFFLPHSVKSGTFSLCSFTSETKIVSGSWHKSCNAPSLSSSVVDEESMRSGQGLWSLVLCRCWLDQQFSNFLCHQPPNRVLTRLGMRTSTNRLAIDCEELLSFWWWKSSIVAAVSSSPTGYVNNLPTDSLAGCHRSQFDIHWVRWQEGYPAYKNNLCHYFG